ncbi:MAG: acyloxyacyl hydrolase [Saprospiraceae bacterium]|nr:acyloxyacyl hydrolase [Saprospiraceae bacterium]
MKIAAQIHPLRLLAVVLSVLFVLQIGSAQTADSVATTAPVFRVSLQNGNILPQNRYVLTNIDEAGHAFKYTKAFAMEYGWQMLGGQAWQQVSKYPRFGFGAQYMRIIHRDELGHPFSVYGFYDGNFFSSKNFEVTNRLSAGLGYGFRRYDPNDRLPNDILSTRLNAFVEMGLGIAVRLNDYLYLEPAFRFTHFSNGNLKEPQKGLNVVSYAVSLRALLEKPVHEQVKVPMAVCQHRHELLAFWALSTRQLDFSDNNDHYHETYGMNYLMTNLHLGYNYEISRGMKLGGGLDFVYDGSNGQLELVANGNTPSKSAVPFGDKFGVSVFIGGERVIDRLSIVGTLGYMVVQKRYGSTSPAFEQRFGFKYHFYRNVFAGVNIRAYRFQAAEAIEFHVGLRKFIR